jgi:hypothetical protein
MSTTLSAAQPHPSGSRQNNPKHGPGTDQSVGARTHFKRCCFLEQIAYRLLEVSLPLGFASYVKPEVTCMSLNATRCSCFVAHARSPRFGCQFTCLIGTVVSDSLKSGAQYWLQANSFRMNRAHPETPSRRRLLNKRIAIGVCSTITQSHFPMSSRDADTLPDNSPSITTDCSASVCLVSNSGKRASTPS